MTPSTDHSSVELGSSTWREHLAALPEIDPPDALWLRLRAARAAARQTRSRWSWTATSAALVAAMALAAVLAWPRTELSSPLPNLAPALSMQPPTPGEARSDAGLRRLDDEIALAYAHDANEAQLAALWETRARLIESLQGPTPALLARL